MLCGWVSFYRGGWFLQFVECYVDDFHFIEEMFSNPNWIHLGFGFLWFWQWILRGIYILLESWDDLESDIFFGCFGDFHYDRIAHCADDLHLTAGCRCPLRWDFMMSHDFFNISINDIFLDKEFTHTETHRMFPFYRQWCFHAVFHRWLGLCRWISFYTPIGFHMDSWLDWFFKSSHFIEPPGFSFYRESLGVFHFIERFPLYNDSTRVPGLK